MIPCSPYTHPQTQTRPGREHVPCLFTAQQSRHWPATPCTAAQMQKAWRRLAQPIIQHLAGSSASFAHRQAGVQQRPLWNPTMGPRSRQQQTHMLAARITAATGVLNGAQSAAGCRLLASPAVTLELAHPCCRVPPPPPHFLALCTLHTLSAWHVIIIFAVICIGALFAQSLARP